MNCSRCGAHNPDGSLFCSSCGGPIEEPQADNALFKDKPKKDAYQMPPAGYGGQQNGAQGPYYNPQQPGVPNYGGYGGYTPGPGIQPQRGDPGKNWAAILGLVLGILSVACCFGSVYAVIFRIPTVVVILLLFPGIIFSIIGLKSAKKGLAIAGLVCSVIGLGLNALLLFTMLTEMKNPNSDIYKMVQELYDLIDSTF